MKRKKVFKEMGLIDEDLIEEANEVKGEKKQSLKRWGLLAAGFMIVLGMGSVIYESDSVGPSTSSQPIPQITEQPPVMSPTPEGYRKVFYYNDYSYAFVEGESLFQLSGFVPKKLLGTLQYDIMQGGQEDGSNQYAETEFATNYAVGGKLYEIPTYPSKFRIAVEYEGAFLLAEVVSKVDGTEISAKKYVDLSLLKEQSQGVTIMNHMGDQVLYTFTDGAAIQSITDELSEAKFVNLTDGEFEAIGQAQSIGKSYQLTFRMQDGADVAMYIIPELKSISMGDNMYQLTDDFLAKYGAIFAELKQEPLPQF